MTAPQLLASVQARGVVLWRDGDALEVKMPEAVAADQALRSRLLDALRAAKGRLLPLLPSTPPEMPSEADKPQKPPSVPQDAPPPSLAPDVPPEAVAAADLGIDPIADAQETIAFLRPFFAALDWSTVKLEAMRLPSGRWVRAWPEPIRDFRDAPTRARRETDDEDFDELGGDLDDGTESALKIVDDRLGPQGWCNKTEEWGMPASFVQGYLADAADLSALWAAIQHGR